jgi:hypothetical protein
MVTEKFTRYKAPDIDQIVTELIKTDKMSRFFSPTNAPFY